jgi:hypothetical protein
VNAKAKNGIVKKKLEYTDKCPAVVNDLIMPTILSNKLMSDVKVQTRDLEQFAQARGWQLIDSYLDTVLTRESSACLEL